MNVLFGFIGVGNMGGALAKAVSKSTKDIWVTDYCVEKAERLRDQLGVEISYNAEIAQNCRYIVLGVKPQMMPQVLSGIKDALKERKDNFILVTMAAGLSIDTIRTLAQGGVDCGIDEETAIKLAAQTVKGSAEMLSKSPLTPDELIKNVCSPGGSTIEGVKSLEEDRFEQSVRKALSAAYQRNIELGKTNG